MRHIPSPRFYGGIFIKYTSLKKTDAELTKVNKPVITHSSANNYNYMLLLTVKPGFSVVNNLTGLWNPISLLLVALAHYRISTLIYANPRLVKIFYLRPVF